MKSFIFMCVLATIRAQDVAHGGSNMMGFMPPSAVAPAPIGFKQSLERAVLTSAPTTGVMDAHPAMNPQLDHPDKPMPPPSDTSLQSNKSSLALTGRMKPFGIAAEPTESHTDTANKTADTTSTVGHFKDPAALEDSSSKLPVPETQTSALANNSHLANNSSSTLSALLTGETQTTSSTILREHTGGKRPYARPLPPIREKREAKANKGRSGNRAKTQKPSEDVDEERLATPAGKNNNKPEVAQFNACRKKLAQRIFGENWAQKLRRYDLTKD